MSPTGVFDIYYVESCSSTSIYNILCDILEVLIHGIGVHLLEKAVVSVYGVDLMFSQVIVFTFKAIL